MGGDVWRALLVLIGYVEFLHDSFTVVFYSIGTVCFTAAIYNCPPVGVESRVSGRIDVVMTGVSATLH